MVLLWASGEPTRTLSPALCTHAGVAFRPDDLHNSLPLPFTLGLVSPALPQRAVSAGRGRERQGPPRLVSLGWCCTCH